LAIAHHGLTFEAIPTQIMSFLEEIARHVIDHHGQQPDAVTLVFPNRRSGLHFRKKLAALIDRPVWAPQIFGIVDFIRQHSPLHIPDRLMLIFSLYQAFKKAGGATESFDNFYFWGDALLKDFDEIDKYMVDARLLFKNLRWQKDLENAFDHLTENQKLLIKNFWASFQEKPSKHQQDFVAIWEVLYPVYEHLRDDLLQHQQGYEGLIYRTVAEDCENKSLHRPFDKVIFAGFNAFSRCEEKIISYYVQEQKAQVFWDADDYFYKDANQEAGNFLREHSRHKVLGPTLKSAYGTRFSNEKKSVRMVGVPSEAGQAQALERLLAEQQSVDERTAVVLANELLLFPVLSATSHLADAMNVTMGYPLQHSLAYSFVEALLELHIDSQARKKNEFYYRPVLQLLQHPYLLVRGSGAAKVAIEHITTNNRISLSGAQIAGEDELLKEIFTPHAGREQFWDYLQNLLHKVAVDEQDGVQKEFIFHIFSLINKLRDFYQATQLGADLQSFLKLFRHIIRQQKLPFEGEPLQGLQVMGILESRTLDFDHVYLLSANEGTFPPAAAGASFIPYSLRSAFGLPTFDQQDAIYAYLFYTLIASARQVTIVYNTQESNGRSGELSRFAQQLIYESGLNIEMKTALAEVSMQNPREIEVTKKEWVMRQLDRYTRPAPAQGERFFTPSAFNTYLDCTLRFYYKYVLDLAEAEEVSEELDPMAFGNILHKTMELAYQPHNKADCRQVTSADVDVIRAKIDKALNDAFSDTFDQQQEQFEYTGQNVIWREVVKKIVLRILDYDQKHTPFEILTLEGGRKDGFELQMAIHTGAVKKDVALKGVIDRIDQCGGAVRILDYKTGKDNRNFTDLPSLFDRNNPQRNKAAFQTFLYVLLFRARHPRLDIPIQAGLFNIREVFTKEFDFRLKMKSDNRYEPVHDVRSLLPDYENLLKELLEEIFDVTVPFVQTTDLRKCSLCPYALLCQRA
jgi:hypothetical protein